MSLTVEEFKAELESCDYILVSDDLRDLVNRLQSFEEYEQEKQYDSDQADLCELMYQLKSRGCDVEYENHNIYPHYNKHTTLNFGDAWDGLKFSFIKGKLFLVESHYYNRGLCVGDHEIEINKPYVDEVIRIYELYNLEGNYNKPIKELLETQ